MFILLAAVVFNFILNFILISRIGEFGAALATGLGWVLIFILSSYQIRRYMGRFDWVFLLKNTLFL